MILVAVATTRLIFPTLSHVGQRDNNVQREYLDRRVKRIVAVVDGNFNGRGLLTDVLETANDNSIQQPTNQESYMVKTHIKR